MKRIAIGAVFLVVASVAGIGAFICEPYIKVATMIAEAPPPPPMLRAAVIAAEAPVDPMGATFTDQLVRVATSPARFGVRRPVKSLLTRFALDARFSEVQVLDAYVSRVYFGRKTFGANEASMSYFGKPAGRMTVAECALLAGLIRSPTYYSPKAAPERALKRRNLVLATMLRRGFISRPEYQRSVREPFPNDG